MDPITGTVDDPIVGVVDAETYRAAGYGPNAGDPPTHDTTFGPMENRLGENDIAVSPNMLGEYPLGSSVDIIDPRTGAVIYPNQRVADYSYTSPGNPNRNEFEQRHVADMGHMALRPHVQVVDNNPIVGRIDGGSDTTEAPQHDDNPVVGLVDTGRRKPKFAGVEKDKVETAEEPERQDWLDIGKAWSNLFGSAAEAGANLDIAKAREDLNTAKSGQPKPTLFGAQEEEDKKALSNPNISQADAEEIIARRRAQTDMDQEIAQRQLSRAQSEQNTAAWATPGPEYQRTIPGTVTRFLGQAAPYLMSGALGPAGPLAMANQMSEQGYGETYDRSVEAARKAHPDWTEDQINAAAHKAGTEAAQTGFENGVVIGLLPVPKVGPLVARMVEQVGLRGTYMAIAGASQDIEQNIAIQKNVDPRQAIYDGVLAHAPANFAAGAAFGIPEAIGEAVTGRPNAEAPTAQETPETQPRVETPPEQQQPAEQPETQPAAKDPVLEKLKLLGLPDNQVTRVIAARALRADEGNETMVVSAVKDTRTGEIVTNERGHQLAMRQLYPSAAAKPDHIEYGYLTNTGRFVDSPMDLARQIEAEQVPEEKTPEQTTEDTDKWVSAIANRYSQERSAQGEIGEVAPGQGYSTRDLVNMGLRMGPEEIAQRISDVVHNVGGDPKLNAAAIRAREAQLSEESSRLSRIAEANPNDAQARAAADEAFDALTEFHNGPVAKLKNNWHAQGMTLQGEVPVDLGTFNGLREAWLKEVGTRIPKSVEMTMKNTANRVRNARAAEDMAIKTLGDEIERVTSRKRSLSDDQVRNNIIARMKDMPCRI